MKRIRRTFTAALAATAVTASMAASPSVAEPIATASACEYSAWKIKDRVNVTCRKAKRVLKGEYGDADKLPGWSCTNNGNLIPEGRCRKAGTQKSFKYLPK